MDEAALACACASPNRWSPHQSALRARSTAGRFRETNRSPRGVRQQAQHRRANRRDGSCAARMGRLAVSYALFACVVVLWVSWCFDNFALRRLVRRITAGLNDDAARVEAVVLWVHANTPKAINQSIILTPMNVLRFGGDCAAKSRLTAALLWQLGIPAGLAMVYDHQGAYNHTVVECGDGTIVDPIWPGKPPSGPVHAINWTRLPLAAKLLRAVGVAPEALLRPRFCEDPKLALVMVIGVLLCIISLLGDSRCPGHLLCMSTSNANQLVQTRSAAVDRP